jgi:hypothetical protein
MKSITQAIRDVREQYEEAMEESLRAQQKAASLAEALEMLNGLPALVNGTGKVGRKVSVAKQVATPISLNKPGTKFWPAVYQQLLSGSKEYTVKELVTAASQRRSGDRKAAYGGFSYLLRIGVIKREGDKVIWNK